MNSIVEEFDKLYSKRMIRKKFLRFYFGYLLTCYFIFVIIAGFAMFFFYGWIGDFYDEPLAFLFFVNYSFVVLVTIFHYERQIRFSAIKKIENHLQMSYFNKRYVFSKSLRRFKKKAIKKWLGDKLNQHTISKFDFLNWLQNEIIKRKVYEYKYKNIVGAFFLILLTVTIENYFTEYILSTREVEPAIAIGATVILVFFILIVLGFLQMMVNLVFKDLSDLSNKNIIISYKELENYVSEFMLDNDW